MTTEALTIQSANDYARRLGLYPQRAEHTSVDGTPIIKVDIIDHDGRQGTLEVWVECGHLYGEW